MCDEAVRASLGCFAYDRKFGFVYRAWAADADEIAVADAIRPALLAADPRALGFDPRREQAAPHVLAVHALRRLFDDPSARFLRELRLEVNASLEPFLGLLDECGRRAEVTHLMLLAAGTVSLPRELPSLRALACAAAIFGRSVQAPMPMLDRLTLGVSGRTLEKAAFSLTPAYMPALRDISLRCAGPLDEEICEQCLDLVLLGQLERLDLWSPDGARPAAYERLLQNRERLAHLRQLVLARTGVDDGLAERFAAEVPHVVWSDERRGGLEAFDHASIAGFGYGGFCFQ